MLGNYLIGLREGLEASLVVSILVAYLVKPARRPAGAAHLGRRRRRGRWSAWASAALLTSAQQALTFQAQEAIGGTLSIIAVGFVTWMIFWMRRARSRPQPASCAARIDDALDGAADRRRRRWPLLAVGREGLETALFLWAAAQAAGGRPREPAASAPCSASPPPSCWAGCIYRGAVRINLAKFFTGPGRS